MLPPNDHLVSYVDDYLHGVLSPPDVETFERHCRTCRICKLALEEAEGRRDALKTVPAAEASEKLVQDSVERIETYVRRRKRRWTMFGSAVALATAASLLIIGGLNIYFYRMAPSPYDLRILGQTELMAGTPASLRVAVFRHDTGEAVAGVPIEIALYDAKTDKLVKLAGYTAGGHQTPAPPFDVPDWKDGRYELRVTARPGRSTETILQTVRLKRSRQLMLSTDKPVYQPGQTIRIRALTLRRPDLKPVAGSEVTLTVTDPKGNVIFKRRDLTSRFGITSADCLLATEIIEGPYQIECVVGDTTAERTVQVEKYVLPKFKVGVTLDKPFYQPGEPVSGTVQADYFFGKPVADAEVEIEVRAGDFSALKIADLKEKTDSAGRAPISLPLPDRLFGREQDDGNARFVLTATVTDAAGQKYAKTVSRIVTTRPIRLEIIPESGTLVRGVANTIYVFTSYADGRPAQTRLVVGGRPQDVRTSKLGVASFEITPKEDSVRLTVRATDEEGRRGLRTVTLPCGRSGGDFLLRPDKAVYDGGETMTLVALGGGVEPVFVDFLKDGQTMLTGSVDLAGGRGQYELDLPPELFGTIELCAYRFAKDGLPVRKTRTIYVRQARGLKIKATLDHQEYRPGAKATLHLALADDQGKPTPGAISLAVVDEAVFSVLGQMSAMDRTFFLLEQELLEPVYAIYDWSPDEPAAVPTVDRADFEQALFSRTAATVVGPGALPAEFVPAADTGGAGEAPAWSPRGGANVPAPHTLAAATYEKKVDRVTRRRAAGLEGVAWAWASLAGVLVLVGLGTWAVVMPRTCAVLAACGVGLFCVVGTVGTLFLVLPAARRVALEQAGMEDRAMAGAVFDADRAGGGGFEGDGGEGFAMPVPTEAPADEAGPATDEPAETRRKAAPPRVRQWFPETLFWKPEVVTDDNGKAEVEIPLADSITTWRLTASAVSGEGRLGGMERPLKVFQPFFVDLNLPVALARGDRVGVPVVVYNYLDKPQTVELTLEDADWFERLDSVEAAGAEADDAGAEADDAGAEADEAGAETDAQGAAVKLDLAPGEVRSIRYPIEVRRVGYQELQVTARGSDAEGREVADAIKRRIEVVPNGRRVEKVASGTLNDSFEMTLDVPDGAIPGSAKTIVKLYPSTFSQLLEGLDAIFQMPYGCFEQTSSTTYPNVLALDYMRRTGKNVPAVEAKARQYIHVGYQRLISFEVGGGGFDWFGNPPANVTLTAYGLMEFENMARVYDVDPKLVERTRAWLLSKRADDGSWPAEVGMLDDGLAGSVQRGDPNLATTAYVAWAVFGGGKASRPSGPTLQYLLAAKPESIENPYVVAMVANAVAAIDPGHAGLKAYVDRLEALRRSSPDGKRVWWEQAGGGRTMFYGGGRAGDVETTALAALALLAAGEHPGTARGALAWLVEQKDARGTWHSTQATVLALKALLEGTGKSLAGQTPRKIDIALGGEVVRTIDIPADQTDVMQQIDLSDLVTGGEYPLVLTDRTAAGTGFQVTFRYNIEPDETSSPEESPEREPLSIAIDYDRTRLSVDETITATATVTNNMRQSAPMVILDLPIPGGFTIEPGELAELVGSGKIARYQITPRKAIVYLLGLAPGQSLELRYRLKAVMPVKVAVPDAAVYEYYDPDKRGRGGAIELEALTET